MNVWFALWVADLAALTIVKEEGRAGCIVVIVEVFLEFAVNVNIRSYM